MFLLSTKQTNKRKGDQNNFLPPKKGALRRALGKCSSGRSWGCLRSGGRPGDDSKMTHKRSQDGPRWPQVGRKKIQDGSQWIAALPSLFSPTLYTSTLLKNTGGTPTFCPPAPGAAPGPRAAPAPGDQGLLSFIRSCCTGSYCSRARFSFFSRSCCRSGL